MSRRGPRKVVAVQSLRMLMHSLQVGSINDSLVPGLVVKIKQHRRYGVAGTNVKCLLQV